jgi:protein-disulfide isomerase
MKLGLRRCGALLACALGPVVAAGAAEQKEAQAKKAPGVVAVVDGAPVTQAQVEERIQGRLFVLKTQEHELRRAAVDDLVGDILIGREAKARGIPPEKLLQDEIEAKTQPVSAAEVKGFYDSVKAQGRVPPNLTEADAIKLITENLKQQRRQLRRSELIATLRAKAKVDTVLEPPRLAVDTAGAPALGPANAPVTLVEFSDFECPYCATAAPVVKKLAQEYGDKLRVVFRNFPLEQTHPRAAKAAEAAACAADQGKFWEMHDKLFENRAFLEVDNLKRYAAGLGLNAGVFDACLDSGKHAARVQGDLALGARYGITGTPTFYVNGRMPPGNASYETFKLLIDEELKRGSPAAAHR